jgi:DNA gyrase subunit B
VKRGKSETYIKDERDLEAFLIKRAAEARVVRFESTGGEASGAELERLLQRMIGHQKLLQVVERRGHPREIVEALVAAGADREFFADKEKLERLAWMMTKPNRAVSVQRDEEHNRYLLQVDDRSNGYPRHHVIGVDFVTTAEYRALLASRRDIPAISGQIVVTATADLADDAAAEADTPAAATDGTAIGGAPADEATRLAAEPKERQRPGRQAAAASKEVRLKSLDELVDYFITAGKKGIAVNRYKGLGEMNPEQLWETTMDPQVRTLLQVRAEDHTEADLMFTTLMGDQVEPRRKFIEDNALDVKNLDV